MKKNSFIEGALIATIGIVVCKIIGLIYVIPFYAMIGTQGGTLYGYAYSIYAVFLNLSSVGIPVAMSKVVSEYVALGYYYTKEKAYKIGSIIIIGLGLFFFLILMFFAPQLAHSIIGDMQGGNTIESVSFVIRVVATALLIVPIFSVTKGYLQGHHRMTTPSISNIIEQLVRVFVLLAGSFLTLKVFHLSIETAVGISVFAATIGALAGYFYLISKMKKSKAELKRKESPTREEAKITTKEITKKIILYAIPFIVIDLVNSAYSMVDTFTVVRTMTNLGYSASVAETTYGVVSTWAMKLTMIVIAMASGLSISLIPNITSLFVKKEKKELSKKINLALMALLMVSLPMTIGLYFLGRPSWIVFYGYDELSILIFRMYIWQALTFSFYTILIDILQSLNDTKLTFLTLLSSFLGKLLLNIPLMNLCKNIGIGAYYGPVFASLIPQIIAIIVLLFLLHKKYDISYKESLPTFIKIILSAAIMFMTLLIVNLFIPIDSVKRMDAIVELIIFSSIGVVVYFLCIIKSGVLESILGKNFFKNIIKKLLHKKG